ncbi:uncharacterized protein LOC143421845 [Maylandia zebra]|uniref:uncharacterized protein LOC143421845 n=1 Tax=Maylandia zebra TaxID=106582 RepID=UPI00403C7BA9
MTAPTKLLIILGENNALKLTLPLGIPKNVNELKAEIENQCGVSEQFRLQYMDTDFNQFLNMTSTFDLKDMDKIKVIKTGVPETSTGSNESSVSSFNLGSPCSGHNPDYDTDILSSPESRSSSSSSSANSTLRSEAWPLDFRIPEFSFDVELQLTKGNQEFQANGTLLTLKPKLKSDILESLSSEIMKYKAYPSDSNLSDVCQALVVKHPCLKEKGSETGFSAWKISLKYKMSNYRGKLKNLGCSELVINSLKRRGNSNVHPNQVKKPRRAEVNFCPDYPAGETRESQEEERLVLLSEFKKKNNDETIKAKMAQTFPHRRQEILQDMPFVADFKSRWPALFSPREINAEFQRITTVPLTSTFMAQLDNNTTKLTKVFRNKGGTSGRKITEIMAAIDEDVDFHEAESEMEKTLIGIYVIKPEGERDLDPAEDIGIIIEGVAVLRDLPDVATAVVLLFGLIYTLNMSYPSNLRYTFEFFQKVLMGLDAKKLSNKVQVLRNKLLE